MFIKLDRDVGYDAGGFWIKSSRCTLATCVEVGSASDHIDALITSPIAQHSSGAGRIFQWLQALLERLGFVRVEEMEPIEPSDFDEYVPPVVFICHSGDDRELAIALRDLIAKAFRLADAQIRCSSAPGSGIQVGRCIDDTIRRDARNCTVLMPVVTGRISDSDYPLSEIREAFDANRPILPVVAGTVDLPSPISGLQRLNLVENSDLHQLLDELPRYLDRQSQPTNALLDKLQAVQEAALAA